MKTKEQILKSITTYNKIVMPEDCILKIAPSQIEKFFSLPSVWYRENVLGEEQEFQGNTATTLGIACHTVYEAYANNVEITREEINEQLDILKASKPNADIDLEDVKLNYPLVANTVLREYLTKKGNKPDKAEIELIGKVMDGIYIGGTSDNITGSSLVDYKHFATKPSWSTIPWGYWIQLMAYAFAAERRNIYIDNLRLVVGVKPTKTIPARCFIYNQPISNYDKEIALDTFKLMSESVHYVKKYPETTHLIFKSMKLKER